ncbi:MAG: GNAT family N-acetyltransferase [Pseudomonadota bacterium]
MADLVSLSEEDLAEVMRIERQPGYDAFIHSWTAEVHAAEMASPDARYFGRRSADGLAGFAILQKLREPIVRLRRIAVDSPGASVGTPLLRDLIDWLFETSNAQALDLHVRPDNHRARHVYGREGFIEGGGEDLLDEGMILTRPAWAALSRRISA